MLNNLKAEMARYHVSNKNISDCIGKSEKSVSNKINGKSDFTRREILLIKKTFFQEGVNIEYLFSDEGVNHG